jgi:hypothetical protein
MRAITSVANGANRTRTGDIVSAMVRPRRPCEIRESLVRPMWVFQTQLARQGPPRFPSRCPFSGKRARSTT